MFIEKYDEMRSSRAEQDAFDYLVGYLLEKNLHGQDKLVTLTGMDMESSLPNDFFVTLFYTFLYTKDLPEVIGNTVFIDAVPIILCFDSGPDYVAGLNFNFLPTDVRAVVLDIFYNAYKGFYQDDLTKMVQDGQPMINEQLAAMMSNPTTRKVLLKMIDDKTGIKISNAYRKYSKQYIVNARLIEYDMWEYIPLLVYKDAVRGANLMNVQTNIITG